MSSSFSFLLTFCLLLPLTLTFDFTLFVDQERCFYEEIQENTLLLGEIRVSPLTSQLKLVFRFFDPNGNNIQVKETQAEANFAFTTVISGTYTMCFFDSRESDVATDIDVLTRTVSFEFKTGLRAKDYNAVAKKEHLKPLDLELRKMEDILKDLTKELEYLRQREAEMRDTNEVTNTRVALLSAASVILLIGMGGWQLWFLMSYFQKKRVL